MRNVECKTIMRVINNPANRISAMISQDIISFINFNDTLLLELVIDFITIWMLSRTILELNI